MQQTIRRLGLPERTEEECASMIGLPLKETFTRIIDMDDAMGDRCAEVYREIFKENNQPGVVSLFPNVRETLDAIHRSGRMITLMSSRSRASLLGFVADMELGGIHILRARCGRCAQRQACSRHGGPNDGRPRTEARRVCRGGRYGLRHRHGSYKPACAVWALLRQRQPRRARGVYAEFVIDDFSQLCGILKING